MVAFLTTFLIALLAMAIVPWFAKRRPVGTPLTWGEAIAAATFAFWLMFWAYGVVPHQWLTYAGNEMGWRTDKILLGPGDILDKLPFTLNYEVLAHMVVVGIYGFFLTSQLVLWSRWQNRGKAAAAQAVVPSSAYGRPLVRKG